MPSPILILTTGGTFDKEYDSARGSLELPSWSGGSVRDILQRSAIFMESWIIQVLKKDSLEMTFDDRELILLHCLMSKNERILITHGTDTMPETAKFLKKHVPGKTIVLVGAMIPNAFKESDAQFNLGGAFMACRLLSHGTYIVMHGRIFDADNVKKTDDIQGIPKVPGFSTISCGDKRWDFIDLQANDDLDLITEALDLYRAGQLKFTYDEAGVRISVSGEAQTYPLAFEAIQEMCE